MTAELRTPIDRSEEQVPAIETTLIRIVVVFRIVGAIWLIALSVLMLATTEPAVTGTRMTVVLSAMVIAIAWTLVTVFVAYRRPALLRTWTFLVVDVALAAWVAMTPSLVGTDIFFAGGFPISSPMLVATTRGLLPTIVPALVVALASAIGASGSARVAEVLAINFLSPLVVAWGFTTIKVQDWKRREAEEALAVERTKLARADERAEMAAHLHDSVLQTLALIQRKAPENRDVTRLARRQERELRAWLNGGAPLTTGDSVSAALMRAAEEIEDEHDVLVEVSTAGDAKLDDRNSGVILAAREAMANAARFSGAARVYVLCEIDEDGLRLVVRDSGAGFDFDSVSDDRRGIRESIVGRLERVGGTATINSQLGSGTEVELRIETQR